jgi:non-homologous end joining protein Ku
MGGVSPSWQPARIGMKIASDQASHHRSSVLAPCASWPAGRGQENIVRGSQHEKGKYVVLPDEEIRAADVKSGGPVKAIQAVDIVAFLDAGERQPACFEMPRILAPAMLWKEACAPRRQTLKREHCGPGSRA